MNPQEALASLRAGNRRFADGTASHFATEEAERRRELAGGQAPSTIVLACSDSRVAPAVVFDQRLGDLFVIRVAGNVVAPELLGSIEFGAAQLGARLIVVMGHSNCGAVAATLDQIRSPNPDLSPHLRSITERIRPAFDSVLVDADGSDSAAIVAAGVRANVLASVRALTEQSPTLAALERESGLVIVGAEYCLEEGTIAFFDEEGRPLEGL